MTIDIRAASEADLDFVIELSQAIQTSHAEWYPRQFLPVVDRDALKAVLMHTSAYIGIAELAHVSVGCVWFELQSFPATPFTFPLKQAYIHMIAVTPEARRRGIGTALMHYVRQRALEQGFEEVALAQTAANVIAEKFYEAQGFITHGLMLRKTLADQP